MDDIARLRSIVVGLLCPLVPYHVRIGCVTGPERCYRRW
jgi:hypothetical protein